MIFRQLFDPETSTYSYLLGDAESREAVLIDSVREQIERDRTLLRELDLVLRFALETHVHADHVTASGGLREALGAQIAVATGAGVENADLELDDGGQVRFGRHELEVRLTPGHTSGCATYVWQAGGVAFTGDALLIRGCGRTDFQDGSARSELELVKIMSELHLAYPRKIDIVLPANLRCGLPLEVETGSEAAPVAGLMESQGRQDAEMWQGLGI